VWVDFDGCEVGVVDCCYELGCVFVELGEGVLVDFDVSVVVIEVLYV